MCLEAFHLFIQKKSDGSAIQNLKISGKFQPFKTQLESGERKDVFQKDLFSGDWHHVQTQVQSSLRSAHNIIGLQSTLDRDFMRSNQVRIAFEKDYLVGYNANVEDYKQPDKAKVFNQDRWVFKIPIRHLDYWASQSGPHLNAGLTESVNSTENYKNRPWVQVNFSNTQTVYFKMYSKYFPDHLGSWNLSNITVSENYFDFSLEDDSSKKSD